MATQIVPPRDTHVYAPGVKGHKAIQLTIDASPDCRLLPTRYPESKTLFLAAINESVPVYEGEFRLLQDVVVTSKRQFVASVREP